MTEALAERRHAEGDDDASWFASRAVDLAVLLLVVAAFVYTMQLTSRSYFFADDWRLVHQSQSFGGLFKPYNNHLSFLILATYRVLLEIFGFDYTPARAVGFLALFAVPLAYYVTTRRQFGALLAALLTLPLIWYGRYIELFPGAFNHFLALIGGIVCAAALNRGRRADWLLGASLIFALSSAGGGVAVAAACLVHNACTRPAVRRWLVVVAPSMLWFVWWFFSERTLSDLGPYALSTSQTVRFVRDLSYTPFESVALGVGAVAVVLVIAYVGYGIWTCSKGLKHGANFLAWTIALGVWAYGIAQNRGVLASVATFRYRYVALGIALLAVVPRRTIVWPNRVAIATNRRVLVAVVIVLVLGSARAVAVHNDMHTSATQFAGFGRVARDDVRVATLDPPVVAANTVMPFTLGGLHAGELRHLVGRYGHAPSATRATVDQRLVDDRVVNASDQGARTQGCTPLAAPFTYRPIAPFRQVVWAPDHSVTVDVRRFGDRWVRLATAGPHRALLLALPSLNSTQPWQIRADGACRAGVGT